MKKADEQPLDRVYRLDENAEWKHLLDHLRFLEGFGLILVLAPEQAGADVCRRALRRELAAKDRTLHCHQLRLDESPGALGDHLLQANLTDDTGAVWVSAPEAERPTADAPIRQLWHDALAALNSRRNPLRRHLRVPVIFAGPMWLQDVFREAAPDLWSVRDTIARIEPPKRDLLAEGELRSIIESTNQGIETESGDPGETRRDLERLEERIATAKDPSQLEILKARLLHRLGKQLAQRYQWDAAEAALLEAEQIIEQRHPSLDDQSHIVFDLAAFFRERGDYSRAEIYGRKAYEFTNAHFGPEDRRTLGSRTNLANALHAQGKYSEAEKEHRVVLALMERVFGMEHLSTLSSQNNLANALNAQGKHAEAEKEHRAVLAVRERVLGEEHPKTLSSWNNLASTLDEQGKHAEAEKEHRAVLAILGRVIGAKHPDYFRSSHNLAVTLQAQARYKEAFEFAQRARDGWREVLGAGHPNSKLATQLCQEIEAELRKRKKKAR